MASPRVDYRVLAIGVNRGLTYAESDAVRVARIFSSAIGPTVPDNAGVLLGAQATRLRVLSYLEWLARCAPEYLLLFFSGHGSEDGILLQDGLLSYEELGDRLAAVPARIKTVILDSCHAGAGLYSLRTKIGAEGALAGLEPAWAEVLAAACPGLRVFAAVAPSKTTRETNEVKGGVFTHGLIKAMRHGSPDLEWGNHYWISDRAVFDEAVRVILERWPSEPLPMLWVPDDCGSSLPLVLAQERTGMGSASVVSASPSEEGLALHVAVDVRGRRFLPTHMHGVLLDSRGNTIGERCHTFEPNSPWESRNLTLELDERSLYSDGVRAVRLTSGGSVEATWQYSVHDDFCRKLAQGAVAVRYWSRRALQSVSGWR